MLFGFLFFLAAEARASHTGPIQQKSRLGGADWDMPPSISSPRSRLRPAAAPAGRARAAPLDPTHPRRPEFALIPTAPSRPPCATPHREAPRAPLPPCVRPALTVPRSHRTS